MESGSLVVKLSVALSYGQVLFLEFFGKLRF